ncbi:hypothetical protein ACD578_27025 (plasmid) [Microvirga sp. RSM25]|uniref:hypothetical protein n=1 Tax=Microvirga sp. RSM25 TaxID=3273802 RepID=UPI0038513C8C
MIETQRTMMNADTSQILEILDHGGYQIRLTQTGLEWVAAMARPQGRLTLIAAADREIVLVKTRARIAAQKPEDRGAA